MGRTVGCLAVVLLYAFGFAGGGSLPEAKQCFAEGYHGWQEDATLSVLTPCIIQLETENVSVSCACPRASIQPTGALQRYRGIFFELGCRCWIESSCPLPPLRPALFFTSPSLYVFLSLLRTSIKTFTLPLRGRSLSRPFSHPLLLLPSERELSHKHGRGGRRCSRPGRTAVALPSASAVVLCPRSSCIEHANDSLLPGLPAHHDVAVRVHSDGRDFLLRFKGGLGVGEARLGRFGLRRGGGGSQ